MKSLIRLFVIIAGLVLTVPALADLKVATSLSDLASVAEAVGGKHVTAISLCKGYEDPHFVPAKPSLMKAIQDADVFVSVGLELDGGWLPLVIPGSRNPKIQPGSKGFIDASEGIEVLDKPVGTVSRAEGDIHPLGNPHYYSDPLNLGIVATHLAEVFGELDPDNAAEYTANAQDFNDKLEKAVKGWQEQLKPYKGAEIVTYHENFKYFTNRFGLKVFGTVEPKPGIPPSPRYLNETGEAMQKAGVKVVIYQPYYDADEANELAKKAGATAYEIPNEVGGVPEAKDVFSKFDFIVSTLVKALGDK
jgi:zinc/manganese transport system substrate-binding protein